MLAKEAKISKDTVRKIAVEDLRKRKVCSRFVPHNSTLRVEISKNCSLTRCDCTADIVFTSLSRLHLVVKDGVLTTIPALKIN